MRIENPLVGKQIIIRNYEKSDLGFLTDMCFDKENGKYLSDPTAKYVDEKYRKALDTLDESQFGYYLVIELANIPESVGSFCIYPNEDNKSYEIGYCIHKNHWKKGYGSEAVSLVLDWLKKQGANKVSAEAAADNIASNALLQKYGFEIETGSKFKKYNMDIYFESNIYAKNLG
jgi:ribosomal-protein-alanine N-acetyltransferase